MKQHWVFYVGVVCIWGAVLAPAPLGHSFTLLAVAAALALHTEES